MMLLERDVEDVVAVVAEPGFLSRAASQWKRRRGVTRLVVGALLLLPPGSQAQSLAAAAARERERLKQVGKPTRPVTENGLLETRRVEDLPAMAQSSAVELAAMGWKKTGSAEAGEAVEAGDEPEAVSEEDEREDGQEAWRQMHQSAKDEEARCAKEVDRIQASLAGLASLFGSAKSEKLKELEKAKQDLATARRAVEELEEMARQHGYR